MSMTITLVLVSIPFVVFMLLDYKYYISDFLFSSSEVANKVGNIIDVIGLLFAIYDIFIFVKYLYFVLL